MNGILLVVAVLNTLLGSASMPATSIGIIGGADGPTAIYVSETAEGYDTNPLNQIH